MRVALINGSPKPEGSASGAILGYLTGLLETEHELVRVHLNSPQPDGGKLALILGSDAAVWAFPLYFDGIPSHLIPSLQQLEKGGGRKGAGPRIYVLVNCGFYEAQQTRLALQMMRNWAGRAGLEWGRGCGIGAGGMLPSLRKVPLGAGPLKNLGKELRLLAAAIGGRGGGDDSFINPNFPRWAYKLGAEMGWRRSIKANGLKVKDLGRRVGPETQKRR